MSFQLVAHSHWENYKSKLSILMSHYLYTCTYHALISLKFLICLPSIRMGFDVLCGGVVSTLMETECAVELLPEKSIP